MTIDQQTCLDTAALIWFGVCYFGYGWAVHYGPLKHRPGLVSAVDQRRAQWMHAAVRREIRIMDAQLVTTLSSGNAFFGSTTVIVLGGLAAMLGAADNVKTRLEQIPIVPATQLLVWELKIMFLMTLVIIAFFKFAWAFRLTHYIGIMIGSLPTWDEANSEVCDRHARKTARLAGIASTYTNEGLRTIYFAIAGLGWFLHPVVFMIGCAWVLYIVYRREFLSRAYEEISTDES
jgi:uncharacterized membrane protein